MLHPKEVTTEQYEEMYDNISELVINNYMNGRIVDTIDGFVVECFVGLDDTLIDAVLTRHCEYGRPLLLKELRRMDEQRIHDEARTDVLKHLLAIRPISKRIDNDF